MDASVTRLLTWLGGIGAEPNDDADTRRRKALLVCVAVLILPISLVWGVLYLALGAPSGWWRSRTWPSRLPPSAVMIIVLIGSCSRRLARKRWSAT